MQAGERACACAECGVVCEGLFDACPDVWARGARSLNSVSAAITPGPMRALSSGRPTATIPNPQPTLPSSSETPLAKGFSGTSSPYREPVATRESLSHPAESQSEQEPSRQQSPLANGFSGGPAPAPPQATRLPPPPPLPPPQQVGAGSRGDVLKWFEEAFDELRNELHAVVSTVTRQQAMLAELLDTREAELRVVMVAESLPELAGEAAAKALVDQTAGLAEFVEARLEDFRVASEASDLSGVALMDGMRELMQRIEMTAEVEIEAAHQDGIARLETLKASMARQLKPVAAAVAEVAAHVDEAQEREAARSRALRASVTKQLAPLAIALEAAVERSDRQMAEIVARLDAMGAPAKAAPPVAKARPKARTTAPATPKPTAKPRVSRRITP